MKRSPAGGGFSASQSFLTNGFGYTVTTNPVSANGVYRGNNLISVNNAVDTLIINFTTGNIFTVGGNFFVTDSFDAAVADTVSITLNDGTNTTFASSATTDFRGFYSSTPITSLSIAGRVANFATMDNIRVGTRLVVPETGTFALAAIGLLAGAGVIARRRRIH